MSNVNAAPLTRTDLEQVLVDYPTRTELEAAVAPLATKAELEAAVAPLATKAELEAAVAPLATKAELEAAVAPLATKAELDGLAAAMHAGFTEHGCDACWVHRGPPRSLGDDGRHRAYGQRCVRELTQRLPRPRRPSQGDR